jgi:trimeric autotransporter adhesin
MKALVQKLALALLAISAVDAQQYTISTVAGGAPPPTPVAAPQASIGIPAGVAADTAGNVYFTGLNCLFKIGANGVLSRVVGNARAGYSGDGGPAASAQLNAPAGLAVDTSGNLYIADVANDRVREVSAAGIITTVAGNGLFGYSGDGGPAASARLAPAAVAVDSAGSIYTADEGNSAVRKVSAAGTITTIAGNGSPGYSGDGGPAVNAQLNDPRGVAVDNSGNLYIADTGNRVIRKVSAAGIITTIAGNGSFGYSGDGGPASDAQITSAIGIAVDAGGNLYIADIYNRRIRKVSAAGIITTIAGDGLFGYSGDGGPAASAELGSPVGVALDASGNLYIADAGNYRIRKVSAAGIITTVAGNGSNNYSGDGGAAANAQLSEPEGVAVDAAGNVYIADTANQRVRKVASGGVITTVAGTGSAGYSGDGGPAISAELYHPTGIAMDACGNLYIADDLNSVIRQVSVAGAITTVAGNGTAGFSGDGGPAASAQLFRPNGVAADAAGNLYIADTNNNRIRKVSAEGIITTIAGGSVFGYSGDGDPAYDALLNSPSGVAVDAGGNLYIADTGNSQIRKISTAGIISTVPTALAPEVGSGLSGTPLTEPTSVAVDAAGNLYIAEQEFDRIRKVSASGDVTIVAGNNTAGYSGDGGPAREAQLYFPYGVAVNTGGDVYIADSLNNAVRLLTPVASACSYSLSLATVGLPVSAAGEDATLAITTTAGCSWAISDLPDWITVAGPVSGSGPGATTLAIAPNSGAPRSATISVAGLGQPVDQASSVLLINPGGLTNAAGGSGGTTTTSTTTDSSTNAGMPGAPVPGSLISIEGNFLLLAPVSAAVFPIPDVLGGLSFQFGGTPVPLFYASGTRVSAQVPWELQGESQANLTASYIGQTSAPQTVSLAAYSPGIFAINGEGSGQGAILDATYRLVDATNPATAGATVVQIFCTGLGPVSNQPATGAPAPSNPPAQTTTTPTVTIGGVPATVQFSGLAPGTVGLYQVNILVPQNVAYSIAVPVVISIGNAQSNTVTMAVE